MVDLSNYLNILRGALQFGGVSPFPDAQASRIYDYLRGTRTPATPAAPETPAPVEEALPLPPQPPSTGMPPRTAPTVSRSGAPSTGSLPPPPTPPASSNTQSQTLLDRLRERDRKSVV